MYRLSCKFLTGCLRAAGIACLLSGIATADTNAKASKLAQFMNTIAAADNFSGSVQVNQNGAVLLSHGYGLANIELNVPNSVETKFRIGSVTKQFTAMCILMLVDRGDLELSDSITDVLSIAPDNWSGITVRNLLNHTSGIMHSWKLPVFFETVMISQSIEEVVSQVVEQPLLFSPGDNFEYSGYGYFILAMIIEEVSGMTFEEFIQTHIFAPAEMSNSGADSFMPIIANRASGYEIADGIVRNAPLIFMPNLTGGGNLYSTVNDLAKWDSALTRRMFISESLYGEMFTPGLRDYGYGWRIVARNGYRVIEHTGGVYGFHADIRRIPEKGIGIFVLTNNATSDSWIHVADGLEKIAVELD